MSAEAQAAADELGPLTDEQVRTVVSLLLAAQAAKKAAGK